MNKKNRKQRISIEKWFYKRLPGKKVHKKSLLIAFIISVFLLSGVFMTAGFNNLERPDNQNFISRVNITYTK